MLTYFSQSNDLVKMLVVVAGSAIVYGIFLAIREFWCWYWKVNRINELLEAVTSRLDEGNRLLGRLADTAEETTNHVRSLKIKPAGQQKSVPQQATLASGSASGNALSTPALSASTPPNA